MKQTLLGALGAVLLMSSDFVFAASAAIDLNAGPQGFCIQSFNAYGPLYAPSVQARTEKMAGFLRSPTVCDVVQLQEVWLSSQAQQLQSPLSDLFATSAPNLDDKIGLMTFTMGPYDQPQTVIFAKNNEGGLMDGVRERLKIQKAFHALRFKPSSVEEEIWFLNLHLHQSSPVLRISQILEVLQWRLQHLDAKWVLSGDFNADLGSFERDFLLHVLGLRDGMEEALGQYPDQYCTYCASNKLSWLRTSRTFDYVFYSNVGGESEFSLRPIRGELNMKGSPKAPWSDHYGVRVHFQLDQIASAPADFEGRRQLALQHLTTALEKLEPQDRVFAGEIEVLQSMKNQLESGAGEYWDYLVECALK